MTHVAPEPEVLDLREAYYSSYRHMYSDCRRFGVALVTGNNC